MRRVGNQGRENEESGEWKRGDGESAEWWRVELRGWLWSKVGQEGKYGNSDEIKDLGP